jgi:hypothetical protein
MDNERCSLADLADVFACLEKANPETLEKVGAAVDRLCAQKRSQRAMQVRFLVNPPRPNGDQPQGGGK